MFRNLKAVLYLVTHDLYTYLNMSYYYHVLVPNYYIIVDGIEENMLIKCVYIYCISIPNNIIM